MFPGRFLLWSSTHATHKQDLGLYFDALIPDMNASIIVVVVLIQH